jgi:putative N6-adenine-specific DNA methylase
LIEAAMQALNIPSGMYRKSFGFQRWNNYEESLWNKIITNAKAGIKDNLDIKICGADISEGSVRAANINIKTAGLEKFITVEKKSFNDFLPQGESGTVMINPPYGGRLDASPPSGAKDLPKAIPTSFRQKAAQRSEEISVSSSSGDIGLLYKEIGNHLKKNFTGHEAWILTANQAAAKQIGLHTSKKIKVYNGPLECRFLKFELYSGSKKSSKV